MSWKATASRVGVSSGQVDPAPLRRRRGLDRQRQLRLRFLLRTLRFAPPGSPVSPSLALGPRSCLIGEAPPNNTGQQNVSPRRVVDPVRLTVGIAEIKLRQIAVKMLLAAPLVDAAHPALEDREIALDGVGVNVAKAVHALAVTHHAMGGEML